MKWNERSINILLFYIRLFLSFRFRLCSVAQAAYRIKRGNYFCFLTNFVLSIAFAVHSVFLAIDLNVVLCAVLCSFQIFMNYFIHSIFALVFVFFRVIRLSFTLLGSSTIICHDLFVMLYFGWIIKCQTRQTHSGRTHLKQTYSLI